MKGKKKRKEEKKRNTRSSELAALVCPGRTRTTSNTCAHPIDPGRDPHDLPLRPDAAADCRPEASSGRAWSYSLNFHSWRHIGHRRLVCWELSHFMMQWMWKQCEHWPQTTDNGRRALAKPRFLRPTCRPGSLGPGSRRRPGTETREALPRSTRRTASGPRPKHSGRRSIRDPHGRRSRPSGRPIAQTRAFPRSAPLPRPWKATSLDGPECEARDGAANFPAPYLNIATFQSLPRS
jgi:hypothetical protein